MTKRNNNNDNPHQWRSIEELENDPEFLERAARQFPEIADALKSPVSRRRVLQVMGASLALAGLSGCRWPVEKIAPFAHRPEGRNPGNPVTYATCIERGGYAYPLHVTTIDGRPIKVEGNPLHPASRGAADVFAQASILELYDPDRSKNIIQKVNGKDVVRTWDDFLAFAGPHFEKCRRNKGDKLAILCEATHSPTVMRLFNQIVQEQRYARIYFYDPIPPVWVMETAYPGEIYDFRNYKICPGPSFNNADVIVCLDADPLGNHPNGLQNASLFAENRIANNGRMSRLYVAESCVSITGSVADVRIPVQSSKMGDILSAITFELFKKNILSLDEHSIFYVEFIRNRPNITDKRIIQFVNLVVHDLLNHLDNSIMFVNGELRNYHLCHIINDSLKSKSGIHDTPHKFANNSFTDDISELSSRISDGGFDTLIILGGNPVYHASAGWDMARIIEKVEKSVHLSLFMNETSKYCKWKIPLVHQFESWGDARTFDGSIALSQPLIEPLYDGITFSEMLSIILGTNQKAYELVKKTYSVINSQKSWRKSIHDGFVQESNIGNQQFIIRSGWNFAKRYDEINTGEEEADDSLEIVFKPDYKVYDGRYANNAWLQELPDPITRLTWGNAALMSPATADKLGVKSDDVVKLTLKGRSIEIPVFVLPGHADGSVSVPLGYGRTAAGRVGNGVGANAYKLRTSDAMYFATGLKVEKTGKVHKLATVQNHHILRPVQQKEIESRAPLLAREADLDEYLKHPDFAKHRVHHPPLKNLWKSLEFDGHRWAMNIDLSRCTGCGACVVACQAENNIPVVGYEQVVKGREMQWLRVDRYFTGGKENPRVSFLPVPCQQCENAPCEQVCPVPATLHTKEGLNDMVYNRCIGMRFCSNNCPYKVRRFNYFYNHKGIDNIEKMKFNPDVTVRSRGVMEKCTYCVQRIQRVKIIAKNEGRTIEDGEITPACAQTCPTNAIVFGDLSDPNSRVSKLHEDPRCYALLEELNVRPRTKYLARLRNPGKK